MVKSEDVYVFSLHNLNQSRGKGKELLKIYFYKCSKDQELCVVSALDENLKRTKTWRKNGGKFQLLLSYISHMWKSILQQSPDG